jgi:hypothetical protein
MSKDEYYVDDVPTALDSDEEKNKLIQRLRQYIEQRNFTILIGNGCSIRLGSPVIHETNRSKRNSIRSPFATNEDQHDRARALLEVLAPPTKLIGVEPLLTILTNVP